MALRDLSKQKKILVVVLILLALLIIALLIYFLISIFWPQSLPRQNNNNEPVVNAETTPTPTTTPVSSPANGDGNLVQVDDTTNRDIKFIARFFVEKFGTYSNQSDYSNFSDLSGFMTEKMQKWVFQTYLPDLKKQHPDIEKYYGMQAKVFSVTITGIDEAVKKAEVSVSTWRTESIDSITNKKSYSQDIKLNFIKINDAWKVEGAYWQ